MSYDIFIQRRIDEVEEKLLGFKDPVERLHVWFSFISEFTPEAHRLLDAQYSEMVQLCKVYSATPDMIARADIRKQVYACCKEIETINKNLKRIPRVQSKLEKDITGSVEAGYGS